MRYSLPATALYFLAALFLTPAVFAETTPVAHYHLKSDEGAIRDTAAPETLESFAKGGPALKASGAPKVMSNASAIRSTAYTGSIKFEDAKQCYAAPENLVRGENWVVEVWAYATQDNDKGMHTVLANGDGGNGFLIIQSGDQWQLFLGGVGGTNLGKVQANTWTHLAIVRDRGITSAWIDGKKVAGQLPAGGGGAKNFSLGASTAGKEPFNGWISEARVSTFKPGQFEGATDFLVDTAKAKVVRDAELAHRRFYKALAPQSNEHQFEVHAPSSHNIKHLAPLLDQMHEIGFETLQAPEHPGSFNYADTSPSNIATMKAVCDYAKQYDIRVGAYQLMMGSKGWASPPGSTKDIYNCVDPATKSVGGGAFGTSACGASAWADMYYTNMWKVIDGAGMRAFKPDGPFHGDSCCATDHPHHRGLEDSQWAQWMWMCKVLREGQKRDMYLTIPDWYVLNGQSCTGMGYREATDNIDIGLQTLLYRQYIYDGTWHKTAGMGWVNLNTEVLHGGKEKDLDRYERIFFTLMSSGAQVWVRGHGLYDGPKSKAMLLKWMDWYKKYRELVQGDIIHLRRPDGRGLDYTLHVDPKSKRGLLLVFNPLKEPITKTLSVPLYYTGLTGQARIREQEGEIKTLSLDEQSQAQVSVTIPADGFSWYVIE